MGWDNGSFCKRAWGNGVGIPYKPFRPIPLPHASRRCMRTLTWPKAMRHRTNYHDELEDHSFSPSPPHLNVPPPRPNDPPSSQLKDFFDGQQYHHLCQEQVKIPFEYEEESNTLQHLYFEDERDVALGLALDGFTFYETLGKSAQKTKYNTRALININHNFGLTIRTHRKHVIRLGMIPGLGSPRHIGSFLYCLRRGLI